MPTWDEITPPVEKAAPRPGAGVTVAFLALALAGHVAAGVLHYGFRLPYLEWLAFTEERAIGDLWLWQFLTYALVPRLEFHFLTAALFAFAAFILWRFGRELEGEIGPGRMAAVLFASIAYGAAVHAIFQTLADSALPASGIFPAVLAVAVTASLRRPSRTVMFFFLFPMRLGTATLLGLGLALFYAGLEFRTGHSAFFPVLGAAAAAYVAERSSAAFDRWSREREERVARERRLEELELRGRVDEILEKISRSGLESLAPQEKRLLERASRLFAGRGKP